MDPRIEIWYLLHDGEITVVDAHDNTVTMAVKIPWLRSRLQPQGDSFVLRLRGLRSCALCDGTAFDWRSFRRKDRVRSTNPADLSHRGLLIRWPEAEALPVTVELICGRLKLDFEDVETSLDTGAAVSHDDLKQVSADYWREFASVNGTGKERAMT